MWVMSTRRVLGGIEMLIGNVRVGLIEWDDGHTYVTIPGHPERFEVESTKDGMKQVHSALNHPPVEAP